MAVKRDVAVMLVMFFSFVFVFNSNAQLDSGPWPMFHHDARHTGLSQHQGPLASGLALKWSYATGYEIYQSSEVPPVFWTGS